MSGFTRMAGIWGCVGLAALTAGATRLAPSTVHIGGLAFRVGPEGGLAPLPGLPGRRTSAALNVPNRSNPREFLIATKPSFPFSYPAGSRSDAPVKFVTKAAGTVQYSGYSWELWDRFIFPIATQRFGMNFSTYRIVHFDDNSQVLRAVAEGLVDAGHAAITKTAARSDVVDFTTGWFDTGLAVCTRTVTGLPLEQVISTLQTVGGVALNAFAALMAAVFVMAIAIFILERATPGPRPVMRRGCCAGIKDSAVLIMLLLAGVEIRMPSGPLSRPAAALCSISSALMTIIVTAVATVALQSAANFLTVSGFGDLKGRTVVMPESTTAEAYTRANGNGIALKLTDTLDAAFAQFQAGVGDAMVYDKPILSSFVYRDTQDVGTARFAVVGEVFERQQYGIAVDKRLPQGVISSLNKAILSVYGTDEVAGIREQWLAENPLAADPSENQSQSSVTEFLTNNFWAIAFMVSSVIGFAMAVGLIAITCRSARTLMRQGQCNVRALAHFFATLCSGESGGRPSKRRRRDSTAMARLSVTGGGSTDGRPPELTGGSGGQAAAGSWCGCLGRRDGFGGASPSAASVSVQPVGHPTRPGKHTTASITDVFAAGARDGGQSTKADSYTSEAVSDSPPAHQARGAGVRDPVSQGPVAGGRKIPTDLGVAELGPDKDSDDSDDDGPGGDRSRGTRGAKDEYGKSLKRPPSARKFHGKGQSSSGSGGARGRGGPKAGLHPGRPSYGDDAKASLAAAALAGMQASTSPRAASVPAGRALTKEQRKAQRKAERKAERKAAKRRAKEQAAAAADATSGAGRGRGSMSRGGAESPVLSTSRSRGKSRSASMGPSSSPAQSSARRLLAPGGDTPSSAAAFAAGAFAAGASADNMDLTMRDGKATPGQAGAPLGGAADAVVAAMMGQDPVWSAVGQAAASTPGGRPPPHAGPPAHARPAAHARSASDASALRPPGGVLSVATGTSPRASGAGDRPTGAAAFHSPMLGSAGRSESLLDIAAAAAAADGHAVPGTPHGQQPPFNRLGSGGPPPSAAGTAAGSTAMPQLGIEPDERLFLKREQWRMMRNGRIAPVLPPNDLMWMIWERVDKLAQQSLLQRAMGRLDVPADLEEVSPKTIDMEAKLLAEELESRGLEPAAAMRAAMLAAMAGTADAGEEEAPPSEQTTPRSGPAPSGEIVPHLAVGRSGAGAGRKKPALRGKGNMLAAAMAARRLRAGMGASRARRKRQSMAEVDDDDDDDGFDASAFLAATRRKKARAPVQHHPAAEPEMAHPKPAQRMALAPPP